MEDKTTDLLKQIVAKVEGKSEDEIELVDLRNKKICTPKKIKKQQKSDDSVTISNDEGVEISYPQTGVVDWRSMRKRAKRRQKNSLEEWSSHDFFYYANQLYWKRYKEDWNLRIGGSSLEIQGIRDVLSGACGFVSNLMMRDYIDFFFTNYIDWYMRNGKSFYFGQMKNSKVLAKFLNNYDYAKSFKAYMNKEKLPSETTFRITGEEIRRSYDLGVPTLVCNYGVVIAINWLILNKEMDPDEVVNRVTKVCITLSTNHMLEVVKRATESFGTYPQWLPFRSPNSILQKIDPDIHVSCVFGNIDSKLFWVLKKERAKEIKWTASTE